MGTWLLLKCINAEDGKYVLREIHEGICGSHTDHQFPFLLCPVLSQHGPCFQFIFVMVQGVEGCAIKKLIEYLYYLLGNGHVPYVFHQWPRTMSISSVASCRSSSIAIAPPLRHRYTFNIIMNLSKKYVS